MDCETKVCDKLLKTNEKIAAKSTMPLAQLLSILSVAFGDKFLLAFSPIRQQVQKEFSLAVDLINSLFKRLQLCR